MSDQPADQVTAVSVHHFASGLGLQTLAAGLLVAGTAWLALAVAERSPKLTLTGGILGAAGLLIVLLEDGVSATTPVIAGGLDHAAATGLLERVHSGALAGLEPLSLLGDLGLALLGFAAVKAAASRWTAAAIAAGAFGEAAGFATGNKPLLLISFAVLLISFAVLLAGLARPGSPGPTR